MSKTIIHKAKGKFNNGFKENVPEKLKRQWDRHNKEKGEGKNERNKLRYKEY